VCFSQEFECFLSKYSNVCVGNTLLIDNTPYKSLFNEPYNVIFVETFDSSIGNNNNYLLGSVMPYLEAFQSSRISAPTFVENNPFKHVKHISQNDPKYKMLFENCGDNCDASY